MRGLDYYNRTVFEWVTDRLGAQGTVAGGGRYDGLFEQLGGKPTPACGFGDGHRAPDRCCCRTPARRRAPTPDVYVVHAGDARRRAGAAASPSGCATPASRVVLHGGGGSFKSQMKKADASGARYALIIGDDEAARGVVGVKPLRDGGRAARDGAGELAATSRDERAGSGLRVAAP